MTERDLDTLLQLVAVRRRRQTVQQLRNEATGKLTVDGLVDRLLSDGSDADDQPPDRDQLAIQLYHTHLPTLADHGVVDFDPENRIVIYQPDAQIETVLDSLPTELPLVRS